MRPNATPSKRISLGDRVDSIIASGKYRKSGELKTTVSDLCDTCLKIIRVHRWFLTLRTKGWKFICYNCVKEKKINLKTDLKTLKLLVEFLPPKYDKKESLV